MRHNKLAMLTGQRFGVMLVIAYVGDSKWLCFCECKSAHVIAARDLKRRAYAACPYRHVVCITSDERAVAVSLKSAKHRCENPTNQDYHNYGGRGIQYLIPSAAALIDAIGPRPANHTLDRIDVNGHYEIGNLRWATAREQNRNRRENRWVEIDGVRRVVFDWANESPVSGTAIYIRLDQGWCGECSVRNLKFVICPHRARLVSPARHSNSETGKGDEIVKNLSASTA